MKQNTSCCWYKFSEFESLKSSDSLQHNEGGQVDPGRQPDNRRKCVTGTVAHQSVLIAFHLSSVRIGGTHFLLQSWSRPVLPNLECSSQKSFLTYFCYSTHHEVLECQSIKVPATLRRAGCCMHFFVAQSHYIDVPCWSALSISCGSRITFMSFFCSRCEFIFE